MSIAVDAVAYFKIFDAKLSVIAIGDAYMSTQMLAATTLRNILGTKTLEEILSDRDEISTVMQVINSIYVIICNIQKKKFDCGN